MHRFNEHQTPTQVGDFFWSLKMRVKFRLVERRSPKPNEAGSMPATLAEAAKLMRMRRRLTTPTTKTRRRGPRVPKRKVVSSNLTAATKIWRYSCYRYVARAL